MKKSTLNELAEQITVLAGTKMAEEAKIKYDILKQEEDRKRNRYLFLNAVLLTILAIINLTMVLLTYWSKK